MQTMWEKHFRNIEGATEMRTIKDEVATLKRGRRVTVELAPDEYLLGLKDGAYYQLGGQVDDIVAGHIIIDCHPVYWCSGSQKWEDA
jgi:hypothetical protein